MNAASDLELIAGLLSVEIGLDVDSVGVSSLEWALRQRLAARNLIQLAEYSEIARREETELQALIELMIVPETWFFRENAAFVLLENHARRNWLPRSQILPKRLLSLPCSTGEEPYSMAMALVRAGLPPQSFQIDAVDICIPALRRAETALYTANSFRGDDLAYRDRFFTVAGPKTYSVQNELRGCVTFRRGNVLHPPAALMPHRYDIIFCRNLLIYMDVTGRQKTIANLKLLLKSGGVIFVGHAEIQEMLCRGFTRCAEPRSFACCLPTPAAAPPNDASARNQASV